MPWSHLIQNQCLGLEAKHQYFKKILVCRIWKTLIIIFPKQILGALSFPYLGHSATCLQTPVPLVAVASNISCVGVKDGLSCSETELSCSVVFAAWQIIKKHH